jgi:hypothetical protein
MLAPFRPPISPGAAWAAGRVGVRIAASAVLFTCWPASLVGNSLTACGRLRGYHGGRPPPMFTRGLAGCRVGGNVGRRERMEAGGDRRRTETPIGRHVGENVNRGKRLRQRGAFREVAFGERACRPRLTVRHPEVRGPTNESPEKWQTFCRGHKSKDRTLHMRPLSDHHITSTGVLRKL